ncbi:MAG TPA: MFS transporter [Rhizomicrobium sp.]
MTAADRKRLSLAAILSACVAYGMGMGLTLPLLSLILERMGEPGSVNGLNLATGGLASLVVTPHMPRAMARLGAAEFLSLALAVAAGSLVAIYFVPSLWLWFPVRFVLSSALNALFVVTEFWINQLATTANRGRYVALYGICMAGSYGIGPTLLQAIGTRGVAPFAAGAGLLLLAIVPVLVARRTAPVLERAHAGSVYAAVRLAPAAFAAAFVFGAIDAGMAGLIPVYAVRSGYTEAHAALCVTAIALGSVVFTYPLGALADRYDRRTLLLVCALSGVAGALIAPFAVHTPPLFYLLLLLWGGLILGVYTIGLTILGERFQGATLASANAAFVMLYCLGLLLGPAGEGVALDLWNPHGLMAVLGAISAGYAVWLFRSQPASRETISR